MTFLSNPVKLREKNVPLGFNTQNTEKNYFNAKKEDKKGENEDREAIHFRRYGRIRC